MSSKSPTALNAKISKTTKIAVIAARFNQSIVEKLLTGCLNRLQELGVTPSQISIHHVPGAFELPLAAKWAAQSKKFAAVICLGAVIRGQTPHFDFVAGQAARGISRVSLDEELPIIFGVLTTNNESQARARAGGKHGHAGRRAADAAVEMIALKNELGHR